MRDLELQRKSEHYWPEEGKTIRYGQIRVTTVTVQEFADFCISTLKVEKDVSLDMDIVYYCQLMTAGLTIFVAASREDNPSFSFHFLG